jgi:hypothetical protein
VTFLRPSEPGRGRDSEPVVATLRRELLAPVDDDLAARHLEAMLLEFNWDLAPAPARAPAADRPRRRAPKVVAACGLAAALSLTSGFAEAGALPATAQHWLSRATRFIGIPVPDAPGHPGTSVPARTPVPRSVPPRAEAVPRADGARRSGPQPLARIAASDMVTYPTPPARAATVPRRLLSLPGGPPPEPVASPPTEQPDGGGTVGNGGHDSGDNGGAGDAPAAESPGRRGGNQPGHAAQPNEPAKPEKLASPQTPAKAEKSAKADQ